MSSTAIASTSTMDPQTTMNNVIKTIYCSYLNVATPNLNTNAMTGNLAPRSVTFGGLVFRGNPSIP